MPNAIHDVVLGSLTLKQNTAASYSAQGNPIAGRYSGGVDTAEFFGGPLDQIASFESEDLGTVCGVSNIATAGVAVSSGTVTIPLKKRLDLSTYAGAGNHFSLSATNAWGIPTAFNIPETGNASASLDCHFKSTDGDTNPVTVNVSQNVASESFNGLWGMGPVSVNGTTIPKVLGVTVNPGIALQKHAYGKNFTQDIFLGERNPFIEIRTYDMDILSALGSGFGVVTSVVVYARKRSGASWALDASTVHCKFSFADGMGLFADWSTGATGSATRVLRIWGETLTVAVAAIT